ncbi:MULTISPECIES: hypothetical protein [unclassified Bacillus (in: firmicutes)]|uniref:hypothetical protein n=1 Tax=unclassified Bacillus (in: firmicutes) TaxID=185979 RepID=UPI0008E203DC|nr:MULTISPECIES: hypothetical protein [unclassified Bacillus (in: firmicutes)]SFI56518.1 hypothetical protein SAMN04488574_103278 [Bacillus sp. 71mf]SFS46229.1 hypothetical protein SAMN04488145_101624 [Bacillus sp. 103mf]
MRMFTVLAGFIIVACFQIGLLYMLQRIEQISPMYLLCEFIYIVVLFGYGMGSAHYFYKHKKYIFIVVFIFFYIWGYYSYSDSVQGILQLHIVSIQQALQLLFCIMFGAIVYGMLFYKENTEKKVK